MDTAFVLRWRLAELAEQVDVADGLLHDAMFPEGLRSSLADAVGRRWQVLRSDFDEFDADLAVGTCSSSSWRRLASLRADVARTMSEALAVLNGLLIRQLETPTNAVRGAPLDRHACMLSDAILREFGMLTQGAIVWSRATVVGSSISYNPLVHVVQIRFPDFSIWSLPLVAHEAGHFVGRELRWSDDGSADTYPVQDLARRVADDAGGILSYRHVLELFADHLAARTLGPAFGCALLLTQLEPHTAAEPVDSHPPAAARAAVVLLTLADVPDFSGVTSLLEQVWRGQLAACGVHRVEPLTDVPALVEDFRALTRRYLNDVRYSGWNRALQLNTQLSAVTGVSRLHLPAGTTLPDVLNAAWLSRLKNRSSKAYDVSSVGELARKHMLTIVAGAAAPPQREVSQEREDAGRVR